MYLAETSAGFLRARLPLAQHNWEPRRRTRGACRVPVTIGNYALGALTAAQAVEQIFPAAQVTSKAGHNQSVRDQILASASAGEILNAQGAPAYIPGTQDCKGASGTTGAILSASGSTAGSIILKIGAASGNPIVLAVGAATTVASMIFGAIYAHHKQAVAKEQNVLCSAVPAANDTLVAVNQAILNGTLAPADGIAAMNNLLSGFQSAVSPILKGTTPASTSDCNAACVILSQLKAIVALRISQYQDLQTRQTAVAVAPSSSSIATSVTDITSAASAALAPVTSAVAQASSSTGIPSWLLYAGGGLLLWKLVF